MRILSENETALLIGDMSKISLPEGVELYLSFGINQLFKRISNSTQTDIKRDWLYFPSSLLESLKQQMTNVPCDSFDSLNMKEPIRCDSLFVFPFYTDSKIHIILVSNKKKLNISMDTLQCLISTYDVYTEQNNKNDDNYNDFMQLLIENSDSINEFIKSTLNLLVKGITKSCAGYYSEDEDKLSRRIIVGDLGQFDLLPPYIQDEKKSIWLNSIKLNECFIPSTIFSNELQFLVNPPEFIYVYNGLRSECSENIISLLLPGSASMAEIHLLKTITSMVSKLSESQFLKSSLLIDYYHSYLLRSDKRITSLFLFEKLFELINKQLRVTKMFLFDENKTYEISLSKDDGYTAIENSMIKLSSNSIEEIKLSDGFLIKNVIDGSYCSASKSEVFVEMKLAEDKVMYVVVGTPKNFESLKVYEMFLQEAIKMFANCISCHKFKSFYKDTKQKDEIIKSRLHLTSKLSSGYFYQIFSKITVLLGKTEFIKNYFLHKNNNEDIKNISKHITTIEESADLVGEYVYALQTLLPNDDGYYVREINSDDMMKKISLFLNGYLSHIFIKNNISLRLDNVTQAKSGFLISGTEIDDVIIPLILAVVDEAVKDGTIAFAAIRELEAEYINISFHSDLIAHKNISNIIMRPFKEFDVQKEKTNLFTIGTLSISHIVSENEMVTIKVRLKDNDLSKINNSVLIYEKGL